MSDEHVEIKMTARELALYRAGEAMGLAKGLEAAATSVETTAAAIAKHGGAAVIVNWMAALERDLRSHSKPARPAAKHRLAELYAAMPPAANKVVELQAGLAKTCSDGATSIRASAAPYRQKFAEELARASMLTSEKTTFVQRIATRALERLSKGGG